MGKSGTTPQITDTKTAIERIESLSLDAEEFVSLEKRRANLQSVLAEKAIRLVRIWAEAYVAAENEFYEEYKDMYKTGLWWSAGVCGKIDVENVCPIDLRRYPFLHFYEFHLGRIELNEYRMLHSHYPEFADELAVELTEVNGRDFISFFAYIPQSSGNEVLVSAEILPALLDLSEEEQKSFASRTMAQVLAQARVASEQDKQSRRTLYEKLKSEFEKDQSGTS